MINTGIMVYVNQLYDIYTRVFGLSRKRCMDELPIPFLVCIANKLLEDRDNYIVITHEYLNGYYHVAIILINNELVWINNKNEPMIPESHNDCYLCKKSLKHGKEVAAIFHCMKCGFRAHPNCYTVNNHVCPKKSAVKNWRPMSEGITWSLV